MKNRRRIIWIIVATMLLSMTTACQLAKEDLSEESTQDRLIGVFITCRHLDLFDTEGFIKDNINDLANGGNMTNSNSEKYNGRLYAKLTTRELTNEDTGNR